MKKKRPSPALFGRIAFAASLAMLLTACETTPPPAVTAPEVPSAFTGPTTPGAEVWPRPDWWTGFSSPELDSFIASARTNNTNLGIAAARVLQAEAQTRIAASALFPTVSFGGDAASEGIRVGRGRWETDNSIGLVLQTTYETDFWGKARANVRAAEALLRSTYYAQQVVALTITADVATTYFSVLGLRQRVAVATQNLELARRVLSVTERRVLGGLSSRVELAQQQTLVAGQEAQIPALQQAEREALNALAVLLGRPPENFFVEATGLAAMTAPPVGPGLPAELLRRRPDIAEAEANLEAAEANVAVARAAFFPSIGLSAAGGLTTGEAFTAIGGTGLLFNIGASVLQTIFDGGRLQGQRALAEAEQLELVSTYRGNILNALYDVESALSLNAGLAEQAAARRRQVESAAQAFDFAERMYQEGLIDLLALLQAQQTLFVVQDELLQIELARLQAAVGLYRALGGGWNQDDPSSVIAGR